MNEATLCDFYGQSALIERLEADFRSGQFVHAYLFAGPRGVGKRSVARLLARIALCTGVNKPCGACGPCVRFLTDNHPDVHTLRPEKSLGVDDVRELITALQLRAFEGRLKVAFIERADRMTPQAQNCLLKTLEEPPEGTLFFLMTDAPGALLPTIVSRCRQVNFHPLTQEQECARLTALGFPPERAALLGQLSEGSVGEALAIARDEGYLPLRERVMRAFFDLRGPQDVLSAGAGLKDDKENAERILDILERLLRDAMRAQAGLGRVAEASAGYAAFAARAELSASLRLLEQVALARKMRGSNVPFATVLEHLLLSASKEIHQTCQR